ncbi:MAG: hypothetical protein L0I62_10860 [Gammaproteobacteria bacterium]|nr:hypothetical protein [Gammaproteobacteria bacterium]
MKPVLHGALVLALCAGLTGLAGCSHSCVPEGWYGARSVPAPRQPPGAPSIHGDGSFAIPGGAPGGTPTKAQACLVYPPEVLAPEAGSAVKGGQAAI